MTRPYVDPLDAAKAEHARIADLLDQAREEGAHRERRRVDLARETARERRALSAFWAVLQLGALALVLIFAGVF